jgi:hypothetical protein
MKKMDPKVTAILSILGGLAALVLIVIFMFLPDLKETGRLSKDIQKARTELDAQYANRKKLLTSLTTATKGRVDMQLLGTEFVPAGREIELITAIETLAAKNGVERQFSLSPNTGTKAAAELNENYTLTVNGKYHAVMQMLVDLEKLPTLMIVEGGTVHPAVASSEGGIPPTESSLSVSMHGTIAEPPKGL